MLGRWGYETMGSSSSRSYSMTLQYSASGSASTGVYSPRTVSLMYSRVRSSQGNIPAFPPASMAMLEIASLSATGMLQTSPWNSRAL